MELDKGSSCGVNQEEDDMCESGTGGIEAPMPSMEQEKALSGLLNATPTMTERLYRERAQLQSKLAEIETAIGVIEAHPQVQRVIDALTKLHWLR